MAGLKQQFTVGQPRARVWEAFKDLDTVVGCLPGAGLTEPPSDDHVKGKMTVKLGPVKANFLGEADIERDEATHTGYIKGSGIDKNQGSRAKGNVTYTLKEAEGGAATTVLVEVDYTLSGALAQFSRGGIVEAVAGKLTEAFAENLEAELSAAPDPAPAAASGDTADGAAAEQPRPAPRKRAASNELNGLSLIGAVIKGWFRNLFGRS